MRQGGLVSLAVCLGVLTLGARAQAQSIWYGNFSNGDFSGYGGIHCGAYSGGGSCPGGVQTNPTSSTVHPACPTPDAHGCRLQLMPAPMPLTGYRPVEDALRVRVATGDDAPAIGRPWGGDDRNELQKPRDGASARAPNLNLPGTFIQRDGYYTEGHERWFGFSVFVPPDSHPEGSFPDPQVPSSESANWHILFQIHAVGSCDAGGPILNLGLKRVDSETGKKQAGMAYQFTLGKRDTYSTSMEQNYTPVTPPGRDGDYRLWPHYDATNGRFNTTPNYQKGRWHTFVLHVVFSTDPARGKVELWMDGIKRYPGPLDPPTRATLYRFANGAKPDCEDRTWFIPNEPMPAYVKTGMYRDQKQQGTDTVFLADLKATPNSSECYAVDPLGGANCPTGAPTPVENPGTATPGALWSKLRGTVEADVYSAVATDAAGNIFAVGYSLGSFGYTNQGDADAIVAKYSSSGGQGWTRQLGSSGGDHAAAVTADAGGNIVVAGTTRGALWGANRGGLDGFVARYSPTGTRLWVRQVGGFCEDSLEHVTTDANGNIYVLGYECFSVVDGGGAEVVIVSFTPNGDVRWRKGLDSHSLAYVMTFGITYRGGQVYAVSLTGGSLNLQRLDASTGAVTLDAYHDRYPYGDGGFALDAQGNWVVVHGGELLRFSPSGTPLFDYPPAIPYPEGAHMGWVTDVALDASGNVVVSGFYATFTDTNKQFESRDGFVARMSTSGQILQSYRAGMSSRPDSLSGLTVDTTNRIVTVGWTEDAFSSTYQGKADTLLIKYP